MPRPLQEKARYSEASSDDSTDDRSSSQSSRSETRSTRRNAKRRRDINRRGGYRPVSAHARDEEAAYSSDNSQSSNSDSSTSTDDHKTARPVKGPAAAKSKATKGRPVLLYIAIGFVAFLAVFGIYLVLQPDGGSSTLPTPDQPSTPPSDDDNGANSRSKNEHGSETKTSTGKPRPTSTGKGPIPSTKCKFDTSAFKKVVSGPGEGAEWPVEPMPTSFVKREGNKLTLDGKDFPLVGPNIYWLGLDENVDPKPSYPDPRRVTEAMAMTVAMGGTTIRAHTLGISTGHDLTLMATANKTTPAAFDAIDYAVWAAWQYGLRLIIPLTDQHSFYHGGKGDFLKFAGSSEDGDFYNDAGAQAVFRSYIEQLLTHVNKHTGVALKDDPTILAWETGNEWGQYMLASAVPSAEWTDSLASFIKALAPDQLVADGTNGFFDTGGKLKTTAFETKEADLVTDHLYPASVGLLDKDRQTLKEKGAEKVFFIGELDWVGKKGGDKLADYYAALEKWPEAGSLMWSLFGHDGECCDWVKHDDGYTVHWGSSELKEQAVALSQHWYRKRGLEAPADMTAAACPQPELV